MKFVLEHPGARRRAAGSPWLVASVSSSMQDKVLGRSAQTQEQRNAIAGAQHIKSSDPPLARLLRANKAPADHLHVLVQHNLQQTVASLLSLSAAVVVSTRTALQRREAARKAKLADAGAPTKHNRTTLRQHWKRFRRRAAPHEDRHLFHFGGPQAAAKAAAQKGLECERALDVRGALHHFEEVDRLLPGNSHYLCMLSKQWTDITYLPGVSDQEAQQVNTKAMEYSQKAITADPQYSLPHVAACISMGRLALFSDNRTKVRLAKEAREEAAAALALDPKSDLAYHLLGRWHYEMAQLGWPVRTLIRVMYGTSLSPGTHQEAMEAYEQASALNPGRLVHRVELGRCYMKLGRHDQALEQLEAAMQLEVEDINAHHTKLDAEQLLKECRKRVRQRKPLWQQGPRAAPPCPPGSAPAPA